ncbi:dihydroxyacetone kinase phosphoryl donor subunit DhaM [Tessaracoccus sp. MC1756]|uniref:dihydroxyacetone kinase phosphoryl donor subunit DhaM n=1 Tax=Tessaracoccus sp. MC1756 TaxID=2760311 RepID=UPI0016016383|nr:dihydroxyacetone kinase phosphoryl donor subunit DhaM [Tessaracoccus sp. MC1756]MBB1508535.1 HPr family phosphocarrier protein [Tessaracoccus sp. MC1756]
MAVGIVVVSHSRRLAEAAVDLALQMVHDDPPPIALAAGTIDGGIGTDATAVTSAISEVDRGDGVVIFVDIGSAVMSAELGIELYGSGGHDIRVLAAPFVEGIMAGVIKVASGAGIDEVEAECVAAMGPKQAHLGTPEQVRAAPESNRSAQARGEARLVNEAGLHARPAAMFVAKARQFDAQVLVSKGVIGPVPATSSIGLATLDARMGDSLFIEATGAEAQEAVDALVRLIESDFAG